MIQQTSMEAYESIRCELGDRQQSIFDVISDDPGLSNHDIAHVLGLEINCVTGRVFELRTLGLVVLSGYKTDDGTGANVMCWKVVESNVLTFEQEDLVINGNKEK